MCGAAGLGSGRHNCIACMHASMQGVCMFWFPCSWSVSALDGFSLCFVLCMSACLPYTLCLLRPHLRVCAVLRNFAWCACAVMSNLATMHLYRVQNYSVTTSAWLHTVALHLLPRMNSDVAVPFPNSGRW